MRFNNIGTDKIGVGFCNKMGTHSLHALLISQQLYQPTGSTIKDDLTEFRNDKKYVIILRDSFDKWKSGYWQELQMLYTVLLKHSTELDVMWKIHDPMNSWYYISDTNSNNVDRLFGNPWMYHGHGEFWIWNKALPPVSLGVYSQLPNIYFLDLKDLSNPKFLEWLKEQDEDWGSVIKIPHRNSSHHFDSRHSVEQFWKEYNEGSILQDKALVCPLSKRYPPTVIMNILEQEQMTIDFIRENHERYLRFE
jgi:hypothetical protein